MKNSKNILNGISMRNCQNQHFLLQIAEKKEWKFAVKKKWQALNRTKLSQHLKQQIPKWWLQLPHNKRIVNEFDCFHNSGATCVFNWFAKG